MGRDGVGNSVRQAHYSQMDALKNPTLNPLIVILAGQLGIFGAIGLGNSGFPVAATLLLGMSIGAIVCGIAVIVWYCARPD